MRHCLFCRASVSLAALLISGVGVTRAQSLESQFRTPPDNARVMLRWWWFGPAVTKPELAHEMEQMKAGGFGGFEIQPVYPLALDDPQKNFRNLTYLSPEFLDDVRFANNHARELGLRVSLTLASGWPYGGPHTPVTEAAAALHQVVTPIPEGSDSIALPDIENGEQLLAAFLVSSSEPGKAEQMTLPPATDRRIPIAPADADGRHTVQFYMQSRTGQQVKRPAIGADGFVLDHFSAAAVQDHLREVATPLLSAFGDHPPDSVFSDSLEVFGADWTPDLLSTFKERRGYDLLPHLPELFSAQSTQAALAVRHDWGETLTELIDANYLTPITQWAHAHKTLFRSQTYGPPAVTLSSNALVDLPEGEGPQWREFSRTRWASSASHLYGRPVTSSETWTWLHSPAFRATPLDMKAEADTFFLQGINQLYGHGWPYSPPGIAEPGWRFYAAAAFNAHNPWWIVMPDVTKYLQRMSWLLRQGQPANDVAVYLPEDDAYAAFVPGSVAVSTLLPRWVTPELTQSIESAGYNLDYIDGAAIADRSIHYPVLILPSVDRISAKTLAALEQYRAGGGRIIAVGHLPSEAPGLLHQTEDSAQVTAAAKALFTKTGTQLISSPEELGKALHTALPADVSLSTPAEQIGFLHRKLAHADIYFLANTGNTAVETAVTFRSKNRYTEILDAMTGIACTPHPANGEPYPVNLPAYGSTVFVLSSEPFAASPCQAHTPTTQIADLTTDWEVSVGNNGVFTKMPKLTSWADDKYTRFFSGVATYRKTFNMSAVHGRVLLSFGEGSPLPPVTGAAANKPGTHALLDAPIRDAAVVYVNGQRAGSVWAPPYRIDVTSLVHAGKNQLSIEVANTAINTLSGEALPDSRLLWARWGKRAEPQDTENMQPLPSGLLGPVTLERENNTAQ